MSRRCFGDRLACRLAGRALRPDATGPGGRGGCTFLVLPSVSAARDETVDVDPRTDKGRPETDTFDSVLRYFPAEHNLSGSCYFEDFWRRRSDPSSAARPGIASEKLDCSSDTHTRQHIHPIMIPRTSFTRSAGSISQLLSRRSVVAARTLRTASASTPLSFRPGKSIPAWAYDLCSLQSSLSANASTRLRLN